MKKQQKQNYAVVVYFKRFEIQMNVDAKRMFFLKEEIQASWILFSC